MESIISYIIGAKQNASIVFTTHSPYVLSKINNLIKAAIVGGSRNKASAVNEIIPKSAWLKPDLVAAYALAGGVLTSIIDDEGLIDSAFLDSVSMDVSEEYMRLVDVDCL